MGKGLRVEGEKWEEVLMNDVWWDYDMDGKGCKVMG